MSGRKVWAADEVLTAADLQDYIQDQVVFVYATSSARAAGILAPTEGMVSYLQNTNALEVFDGSAWVDISPNVGTAGTYTKVTTDAKGRVSSGTTLSATDIPNLDSGKITTGTFDSSRITGNFDQSRITGTWTKAVDTTSTIRGAGVTSTAGVSVTGAVVATGGGTFPGGINAGSGGIETTGVITASGVITFADVYNRTNSGRAVFVASNGVMGIGASSERFKENIVDADIDVDAVANIRVRNFTFKPDFSDDDSVQVGVIAEELIELGLEQFVFFDDEGVPDGVAYDKLALALIPLVQKQQAQIDSVIARLDRLEK